MSENSPSRRILHLVIDGFPADNVVELSVPTSGSTYVVEVFQLTEENAGEALAKIFAADSVTVWGKV